MNSFGFDYVRTGGASRGGLRVQAATLPLLLAGTAHAASPPVPPLDFRLDPPSADSGVTTAPSDDRTGPTAQPDPQPAPQPAPRPDVRPTAVPAPAPARTTAPARAAPSRPADSAAAPPARTRAPADAAAPAASNPAAASGPLPATAPVAEPDAEATAAPAPVPSATATGAAPAATQPLPPVTLAPPPPWRPVWWQVALALVGGILALACWWWLRQRARQRTRAVVALIPDAAPPPRDADRLAADYADPDDPEVEAREAELDAAVPAAVPPVAVAARGAAEDAAATAAPAAAPPPDASITLSAEIREVEFTLTALVLRYAVTITNEGATEARGLAIRAAMIEAGPGSEPALDRFFREAELIQPTQAKLAPGAYQRLENELRLPLADLRPLTIGDRPCVVPMLAFLVRYDGLNMGAAFARRAWIVGREADPPRPRMAPFRLDRGARRLVQVGLRIHREG